MLQHIFRTSCFHVSVLGLLDVGKKLDSSKPNISDCSPSCVQVVENDLTGNVALEKHLDTDFVLEKILDVAVKF